MSKYLLFVLSFLFVLSACNQEEANNQNVFFNLSELSDELIANMEKSNPEVLKFNKINEYEEETTLKDIDWTKELELLKQADINKAAFKLSYDTNENQNEIAYSLKEDQDLPVKTLVIQKDEHGQVTSIKAELNTKNYLYHSAKSLHFELENNQIKSYHILGWQKLFIGSKKEFEISGKVKA